MNGNTFVDTNVLVYSRDVSKHSKQVRAVEWMSHLWRTGAGRLSMQVINEYYSVVTTKLKPGLDVSIAREDVEDLLTWQPLPLTPDLIFEAWRIQDLFQLSWWDSLIVTAAKNLQCTYLLSEDFQHFQNFQGTRVIDPFQAKPGEL